MHVSTSQDGSGRRVRNALLGSTGEVGTRRHRIGASILAAWMLLLGGCAWHTKQFRRAVAERNVQLEVDRGPEQYELSVNRGKFPLYFCLFGCTCRATCGDGSIVRCTGESCAWADELGCWSKREGAVDDWKICPAP